MSEENFTLAQRLRRRAGRPLKVAEWSEMVGKCSSATYEDIKRGRLPGAYRIGASIRLDPVALARYLEGAPRG